MSDLHHPVGYFTARYSSTDDPWGFDERWYERRKYAVTLASLPRHRYRRAYEPGCANGALTELLAPRCDRLVASELVEKVADRARRRLKPHANVDIATDAFPEYWPPGGGDLLVLSEVAYYLTDRGVFAAGEGIRSWLEPLGDVIAVHYTGATDYPRPGWAVVEWLDGLPFLNRRVHHLDQDFELAVWRRDG